MTPEHQFYTLQHKYNVAAPRYTSYPTVPYWQVAAFNLEEWKRSIQDAAGRIFFAI